MMEHYNGGEAMSSWIQEFKNRGFIVVDFGAGNNPPLDKKALCNYPFLLRKV